MSANFIFGLVWFAALIAVLTTLQVLTLTTRVRWAALSILAAGGAAWFEWRAGVELGEALFVVTVVAPFVTAAAMFFARWFWWVIPLLTPGASFAWLRREGKPYRYEPFDMPGRRRKG